MYLLSSYRILPEGLQAIEIAMEKNFPTMGRCNSIEQLRLVAQKGNPNSKNGHDVKTLMAKETPINLASVTPKMWANPDKEGFMFKKGTVSLPYYPFLTCHLSVVSVPTYPYLSLLPPSSTFFDQCCVAISYFFENQFIH